MHITKGTQIHQSNRAALSRDEHGDLRVGWLLKLRVRLNSFTLDQQLAFGFPASWSRALQLRTLQLATARHRSVLARTLHNIVAEVQDANRRSGQAGRGARWSNKVPITRSIVLGAEDALLGLAGALTSPACNNVRGIALTSCLLRDPASPLYSGQSLEEALEEATAALQEQTSGPALLSEN